MSNHAPPFGLYLESNGKLLLLEPGEHLIGRSSRCSICLDGPGISRQHARLRVSRDRIEVEDLGSKNGTFVNDASIARWTEVHPQDTLRIGRNRLVPVRVSRVRAVPTALPAVAISPPALESTSTDVTASAARVLDLVEILAEDLMRRLADPNTVTTITTAIDDLLDGAGMAYPALDAEESLRLERLVQFVLQHTGDEEMQRWGTAVIQRLGMAETEYVAC
jgi:pSer/pThr/pTyr-binding forkhead associated (FHA) protein